MQGANPNFYHAQRLDEQGRLKDVIWVDARSRAAYEEFGDVVCFDATYLTNEYELPFVNFVGVNHHGQSILLGCALVSHENCDTFKWIFQELLTCMNNRAPKAILTDQAVAMRKPIKEVMPQTLHRWCIWHIMRKIPENLENVKDFKGVLKAVVYESLTVQEFESRWSALITEYQLEYNDWLGSLFKERHMWVPAYMRDYFWAGMKTTQRVESINSFFDGFVNRNTKLFEFPQKYAKALEKRIRDETAADANYAKYVRRLVTGFAVERVFQKLYTNTKFQEVQAECSRMMYCYCKEEKSLTENITEYVVEDRVWILPEGQSEEVITNTRRDIHATFNKETKEVLCDCRKFVTHAIMCKHMMRILDQNRVLDVPEQYIVSRWRKDILRKYTRVRVLHHDPSNNVEVQRYNRLMAEFEALCDAAAMVNEEAVRLVSTAIFEIRVKFDDCKRQKLEESVDLSFPDDANESDSDVPEKGNEFSTAHEETIGASISCPRSCDLVVKDPLLIIKPRGRPKGSRNKTLAEMRFKKPKKLSTRDSKP
ncbi:protein FAR-RED IMPAIRED RESPONSE 1-like [Chenopodium quinoa]|uniref:protein FAR-RED IMPAIRED RESPONSE 1-like n=1 Tax=Chenopodium quinoa TaxID=63459 RepID=UPI000B782E62|nr:protein FAR-RED IMPAIRED RESPONSE 1-like [Chenopodium quinoa]